MAIVLASSCALSLAVFACGGGDPAPEPAGGEAGEIAILFSPMFSAFDGVHDFKIPAMVEGVKKIKWSASDPSMVDLEPSADGSTVMIKTRKAGKVTITAKSGSLSGSTELTIQQATPEDWEFGNQRYNNGIVLQRGRNRDGGQNQDAKQAACTNCHATAGSDVEHTPMQTGGYTDEQMVQIFTQAVKPEGSEQRIMPLDNWTRIHKWEMNDDAKKGLVVYLRSLEPKSQGAVDWGGRNGRRDGGGGRRDGGRGDSGGGGGERDSGGGGRGNGEGGAQDAGAE